jgi:hypothetical protein
LNYFLSFKFFAWYQNNKKIKINQNFKKGSRSHSRIFLCSVRHTMSANRHFKFSNLVLYFKSYYIISTRELGDYGKTSHPQYFAFSCQKTCVRLAKQIFMAKFGDTLSFARSEACKMTNDQKMSSFWQLSWKILLNCQKLLKFLSKNWHI